MSVRQAVLTHENTGVSKQNRIIENDLLGNLKSVTKSILSETKQHEVARWTVIFGVLRPKLDRLVKDYLRESLTRSYSLGAEYSVHAVDRRLSFFLTESDINNVKILTNAYADRYWNRIQTSFNSKVIQDNPNEILNPAYVDEPIAISASTEALSTGTQRKAESLLLGHNSGILRVGESVSFHQIGQVSQAAVKSPAVTPSLLQSRAETISTVKGFLERQSQTAEALPSLPAMQFIWVTANNACKNLCDPIRGVTWYVGQPFPYHPPRHPYCRCRLFLIRVSS